MISIKIIANQACTHGGSPILIIRFSGLTKKQTTAPDKSLNKLCGDLEDTISGREKVRAKMVTHAELISGREEGSVNLPMVVVN